MCCGIAVHQRRKIVSLILECYLTICHCKTVFINYFSTNKQITTSVLTDFYKW